MSPCQILPVYSLWKCRRLPARACSPRERRCSHEIRSIPSGDPHRSQTPGVHQHKERRLSFVLLTNCYSALPKKRPMHTQFHRRSRLQGTGVWNENIVAYLYHRRHLLEIGATSNSTYISYLHSTSSKYPANLDNLDHLAFLIAWVFICHFWSTH